MCFWNFIPEKWNFRILKKSPKINIWSRGESVRSKSGKLDGPESEWSVESSSLLPPTHFWGPRTFLLSFFGSSTFVDRPLSYTIHCMSFRTVHFHSVGPSTFPQDRPISPQKLRRRRKIFKNSLNKYAKFSLRIQLFLSIGLRTIPCISQCVGGPKTQCRGYHRKIFRNSKFLECLGIKFEIHQSEKIS